MDSMDFDFSLVVNALPLLLEGAFVTLKITALSVMFGIIIGLFAGIARISSFWPVRALAAVYVDFIRGTPLLVQIYLMYFALPVVTGMRIDPFFAAITACSVNSGAYVAEIFRAGIQAVDEGQMEAGRSLGMTWTQTMRYIIIPQAFKQVIPPLGNEFIALLKDSSLVSVIGFEELTRRGQLVIARTYGSLEIWVSVAILYLIMTLTISRFVAYLERRFKIDDRR
jgi:glutamine transport system permease protein